MALAFLKYLGAYNGNHQFEFDIGSNLLYRFIIGNKSQIVSRYGIKMLKNPDFASPLRKVEKRMLGRGGFAVPASLINAENNLIQLMSYRTADHQGMAISEIHQVQPEITEYEDLPEISFSIKSENMSTNYVPFQYKEKKFSESLSGWSALLNMLPTLLPTLLPAAVNLIGNVLGAPGRRANDNVNGGTNLLANPEVQAKLSSPEMQDALKAVLTTLISNQANSATAQSNTLSSVSVRAFAVDGGVLTGPAIAGLIAAVLPAVMPIIDKALSPETIHALADPAKTQELLKIVLEGMRETDRNSHEARLKRLQTLKTAHPTVTQILERLAASQSLHTPDFKTVESVRLTFTDTKPLTLLGRTMVFYSKGKNWVFSVQLSTPKPIGRAILQLLIKETPDSSPLLEKKFQLDKLESGQVLYDLKVTKEENDLLPINTDLYVQVNLVWKTKSGKFLGTRKTHLIQAVENYILDQFQGVEMAGLALNDTSRYRTYWHKVWEGGITEDIRRFIFDCKYYYLLEENGAENRLMETKVKYDEEGPERRRLEGKIKSGYVLNPIKLNHLINKMSEYPSLGSEKLKALMGKNLNERANQTARVQVELKGKKGDTVTLWSYPVFDIHRILLKKVEGTDEFGQLNALSDELIYFPLPSAVHFIGVKSERV